MMKVDHFPSPAKTPWVFNIELLLSSEALRSYSEAAFGHESPHLILSQQCLGLAIIPYISATFWVCISGSTIILTG